MVKILFVDDDINLQKIFKMVLAEEYTIYGAYTGMDGIVKTRTLAPDVVLLDVNLPDIDGITVLKRIMTLPDPPLVIMVSALQDTKLIVAAVKNGAYDYIIKSTHTDYNAIKRTIRQAIENAGFFHTINKRNSFLDEIIGESSAVRELKHRIVQFAPSDFPVLIQGESGTGKELVAAALHRHSHRKEFPFVPVNCGAIPLNLVETSLFGSEKGAFTDAVSTPGYFEKAHKGSIFLDEIGEMAPDAQVKLLRVLEAREFERVGGNRRIMTNVRVISATNRKLKSDIREGKFREDLYYRLGVLLINIPPLHQRREDIPLLAAWFAGRISANKKRLSPEAMQKLCSYSWPGNIRELRNVLERSSLLAEGDTITAMHIVFDEER